MSDAILPHGAAKLQPTITMVKAGPFVVRHLAPGKPFLEFTDGKYVLVYPKHPDEMPILSIADRLRYRINQWLISRRATWYVPPMKFSFASLPTAHNGTSARPAASRPRAAARAKYRGRMRASVVAVSIAVGRSSLIVFLGFMALMGVTRFVHVDAQTVFQSVHFGIPHFLTPWREANDPVDRALHGQPNGYSAIPYYPSITPRTFSTPPSGDNSPQVRDKDHIVRDAAKGWIPLPGGGPFPMNMPAYGDDGQKGPINLTIHPPTFTSPDAYGDGEDSGDAVALLGATPTPVAAPPRPDSGHIAPKKVHGPRVLAVHSAREPVTPRAVNHPTPQPHLEPVQQQPQQQSRDTVNVQLMPTATQAAPTVTQAAPTVTPRQSDASEPQHQTTSADVPATPKFNVVTKNGDALVVMDHGQMKQISVGQTLPDGSTLLTVQQSGGGFSTSRGNYVAY
ncbi:hypothetical protein PCE31107_02910 [Pandoraea cepalis]|uniref:Uncharacterized protein n=3 Tax=Burkholderiaceae TaxID=119060 RepID=A0A5E4XCL0_9BURK|nr:hypothetical protein PCE31107_02910 [Pandoraea cepalis]VVE34013.1 hypothetical protein PTE31013_03825 [Pandoraea terrigena]